MKPSRLLGLTILLTVLFSTNTARATGHQALPCCEDRCGNVAVPYPFGIGDTCSLEKKFNITCDNSTGTPTPFLGTGNVTITDISLSEGELRVLQHVARDCYDQSGLRTNTSKTAAWLSLAATKNTFTAVGCDTHAVHNAHRGGKSFTTACISCCDDHQFADVEFGTNCSKGGCCQLGSSQPD